MTNLRNDTRITTTNNLINRRDMFRPGKFMVDDNTKKFCREDSCYRNTINDHCRQINVFRTIRLGENNKISFGMVNGKFVCLKP